MLFIFFIIEFTIVILFVVLFILLSLLFRKNYILIGLSSLIISVSSVLGYFAYIEQKNTQELEGIYYTLDNDFKLTLKKDSFLLNSHSLGLSTKGTWQLDIDDNFIILNQKNENSNFATGWITLTENKIEISIDSNKDSFEQIFYKNNIEF